MRRFASVALYSKCNARFITGVAPIIHFPSKTKTPKDEQIQKNTRIAIEMIQRFKGEIPAPFTRKSTATIEQVEREIEALLGGAQKLRKETLDDKPMDKLTLMERCLRHALWSYYKDEGKYDFDELSKWIVYTSEDEAKMAQLKREVQSRERIAQFRNSLVEKNLPESPVPTVNWAQEYRSVIDRELISEKRFRYDVIASNTFECDDKQIDELLKKYRKPLQDKRLDDLVSLLERFKPVLAREAIMQRLTIKHLEGQLGIWRYLDWCPEVRDRAELEVDITGWQWWSPLEERRLLPVRLRSVNEVREIMAKKQAQKAAEEAERNPKATQATDSNRDRLLKEVLALQARINQRSENEDTSAKSSH